MLDSKLEEKYKVLSGHLEEVKTIIEEAKEDNFVKDDNKMKLSSAREKIIAESINIAHNEIKADLKKNKIDYKTPLEKIEKARKTSEKIRKFVMGKRVANLSDEP